MDQFSRAGLVFDVVDAGDPAGTPVVLLHGFPQSSAAWRRVTPALNDAGYRTVAPNQRGYSPGARPRGRGAYALRELTDDVLALDLPRFHLVGHDWGAAVAWNVAFVDPGRVLSLTTLSVPHPRAFAASMVRSRQALLSVYMLIFQVPGLPEWAMLRRDGAAFRRAMRRAGMDAASVDLSYEAISAPGALTAELNWYRALPFGGRAITGPVTVPTLHVWSSGDVALARTGAELTARYVTGPYRFEAISGSHWIPEEQPTWLAGQLLEWFTHIEDL